MDELSLRPVVVAMLAGAVALPAAFAAAAEPPPLPASAKRLNGPQIAQVYDGRAFRFENFTVRSPLSGIITHDLENSLQRGSYVMGGESGSFEGAGRVKGDKYCYRSSADRQICNWVYLDGDTVYEVNGKGLVEAMLRPEKRG